MFTKKLFALFISSILICIYFNVNAGTATSNAAATPKIQHWQTQNGMPVYFVRAPELPIVDIAAVFAAGSGHDGKQPGIASLTNALLDEGAGDLSATAIAQRFDSVGAIYQADITPDMAWLSLRSLVDPKYLQPALQTFTTVLSQPQFPEDAIARLKNQTLLAIQQMQQSPSAIAGLTFFRLLYGDQAYGAPALGTPESVRAIQQDHLKQFYQRYYVAKNGLLVLVGDLSRQQAAQIAETLSAALKSGQTAAPLPLAQQKQNNITKNIEFPSQQTAILIGELGITRDNPERFALYVGNYILGGGTLTSRLYQTIRGQNGLAYNVGSDFSLLSARGPFIINLQTRNDKANEAIQLTRQTLSQFIEQGPSAKELQAAKEHIIGAFPLGIASNDAILTIVANIAFYHLPLDYLETYTQKINAVTLDDVRKAFQKYVHPDQLITVTVGQRQVQGQKQEQKKQ